MRSIMPPDNSWMDQAECKDATKYFYPTNETRHIYARKAKLICFACPVQEQCREYAEAIGEEYGIWGGVSREDSYREQRNARNRR